MAGRKSWKDVRAQAAVRTRTSKKALPSSAVGASSSTAFTGFAMLAARSRATSRSVLGMTQANVSRIEREDNVRLGTLARYVEGLGGRLEIHAIFDDVDLVITPGRPD